MTEKQFAVVELMGHRKFGAEITEVERFGGKFLQARILGPDVVQIVHPQALYAVTACTEEQARRVNTEWVLRQAAPSLELPAVSADLGFQVCRVCGDGEIYKGICQRAECPSHEPDDDAAVPEPAPAKPSTVEDLARIGDAIGKLHDRIDELEAGIDEARESLHAGHVQVALDALDRVLEPDGPRLDDAEPISEPAPADEAF